MSSLSNRRLVSEFCLNVRFVRSPSTKRRAPSIKVAGRYDYGKAHATETPLSTGWTAANTHAPGGKDGRAQDLDYRAALGSVGYLATRTTPWLLCAFGALSTASAKIELLTRRGLDAAPPGARIALARVLRFARSYPHIGLTFRQTRAPMRVDAIADASHTLLRSIPPAHTARDRGRVGASTCARESSTLSPPCRRRRRCPPSRSSI